MYFLYSLLEYVKFCEFILLFVEFLEALSSSFTAAVTTSTVTQNVQSSSTQTSMVTSISPQSSNLPAATAVPPNPLNAPQPAKSVYLSVQFVIIGMYADLDPNIQFICTWPLILIIPTQYLSGTMIVAHNWDYSWFFFFLQKS